MRGWAPRLKTLGLGLAGLAFCAGATACWLWMQSVLDYDRHLSRAFVAGVSLHEALRHGSPVPDGIVTSLLPADQAVLAEHGDLARLPGLSRPIYETHVTILSRRADPLSGESLSLWILSDKLRYPLADIAPVQGQTAAQSLGNVTRLLATYCSEPILVLQLAGGPWMRVDGTQIWGCPAAPRDLRLPAVLLGFAALAILGTLVADSAAHFDRFARALRRRRQLGGPQSYAERGPLELREIVAAVNSYLEGERASLERRATFLSGISHDLGNPAARLRLRSALIEDQALRQKLEADIDRMTGMIEGVLTYTRSEQNAEEPRLLSVTSLVDALVADYQDMSMPVQFEETGPQTVEAGRSLFSARRGQGALPPAGHLLATARPIALHRALSNLIDNALKYGRRAAVSLSATGETITIRVQDAGHELSVPEIEALVPPFKRGAHGDRVEGFGLGLTIVDTVAQQHGGRLSFERTSGGMCVCLEIARS